MRTARGILFTIFWLLIASHARADLASKAVRELAEAALKKFGKEAVGEGTEVLARRIASATARHGDDVLSAVRRVGPKAIGLADEAGENAPRALRLLTSHGDDAARLLASPKGMALFAHHSDDTIKALLKHNGIAEELIESLGDDAVKALGSVSTRNGRRLAMLAKDGATDMPGLMNVIARHGDPAMEFVWKHKATLAGGAALATFLANPEPFISGTNRLGDTVAANVIKPVIQDVAKPVVQGAVNTVSTLLWAILILGFGASAVGVYLAVKYPRAALGAGKAVIGTVRARRR